ncbi:MAG: hypothetical protein Q8S13_05140 [Dehalococcoidia bacterium]|nr:hypothetical protein [Dehalococcoidia bacterium]
MKRSILWTVTLALPLMVGAAAWAAGDKAGDKASPKGGSRQDAVQACTNMMAMARRMGNGDVMLGMTRMREMMGGQGGMMGGDGMKPPGTRK